MKKTYSVQIINATQSAYPDIFKEVRFNNLREAKRGYRDLGKDLEPFEELRLIEWDENGEGKELDIKKGGGEK